MQKHLEVQVEDPHEYPIRPLTTPCAAAAIWNGENEKDSWVEQPILWWGGRDGDAGIEVGCEVCVVEA